MHTSIGDRMKNNYENRYRYKLTRRTPVIMRLDGRAFHTLTKKCDKPFDAQFNNCMISTAMSVLKDIQGSKCAYIQSDEISILITDFDKLTTEAWFDYNIQKMCSIAAATASVSFSWNFHRIEKFADSTFVEMTTFDCRVFNLPKDEVCNYFIWRQKDWIRNSVSMLARAHYSHKELMNKSQSDMHEMLHKKGVNWADLEDRWKNGIFIYKGNIDNSSEVYIKSNLVFTQNREPIENYLLYNEEE